MRKLAFTLTCRECQTTYDGVPDEDEDLAPVHCPECGAFICFWQHIVRYYSARKRQRRCEIYKFRR
jgi:NAD-dependent SIR2 family protein deacetylase